jgi:hypothetical protein
MKRLRSFALLASLVLAATSCKKKDADPGSAAPVAGSAAPAPSGPAPGAAAPAAPPAPPAPAAAGSAAPAAPATDDVTIATVAAKVGDKETETSDESALIKLEPTPGQTVEVDSHKHSIRVVEVVAVDGGAMTKVKVSYPEMTDTSTSGGKSKDKAVPVVGKSYLVWREGGATKVTHEDGSEVTPEEQHIAAKITKDLGHPDPMAALLASKTWKAGVKVDLTADELAAMGANLGDDDAAPQMGAGALTLKSADATTATFEFVVSMTMKLPKGEMKIDLTLTVKIDRATARPTELSGSGPMSGNMGMPLTGTMTAKSTYTY